MLIQGVISSVILFLVGIFLIVFSKRLAKAKMASVKAGAEAFSGRKSAKEIPKKFQKGQRIAYVVIGCIGIGLAILALWFSLLL